MKSDNSLVFTIEVGSTIALLHACVHGQAMLRPNGLHVAKIADDQIALPILAVCAVSCVLATVVLQRINGASRSSDVWAFAAAVLLGGLATSAIANGGGTINGMSPDWISGPAVLWLIGLTLAFLWRVSQLRVTSEPSD